MALRVMLADDHGVLRDGVQRLLEAQSDIKVVCMVDNGHDAVEQALQLRPDIVVMDITMPGLGGIDATRALSEKAPQIGVVMLSMHSTVELVRQALLAGARGYLLKESAGREVEKAVRAVAEGRRFLGAGIGDKIAAEFPYAPKRTDLDFLTPRERDVLRLVVEGRSSAEAAAILGLSPRSVDTYRARLMDKLKIDDLPSLVKFAIRHGITTTD
jgi:DNA-binding NarL/FixJ family response regulator